MNGFVEELYMIMMFMMMFIMVMMMGLIMVMRARPHEKTGGEVRVCELVQELYLVAMMINDHDDNED